MPGRAVRVLVRPAVPDDAAGIAAVQVDSWRDTYPTLLPDSYLSERLSVERCRERWQRTLQAGQGRESTLVAEHGGGIVGYASGGRCRDRALAYDAEVYELYLLPDWRERGLGRALLLALAARLHEQGMGSAVVEVLAGNPSRWFYEAMGARPVAYQQHHFQGEDLPAVLYAWPSLADILKPA
jgi:L-amino acid N-acyltransferase YncA